ncbi:hypothetical protein CR513_46911, partial [Mucuna pruriens]
MEFGNLDGLAREDPHKHLKEFHVVFSMMRSQEIPETTLRGRNFHFSWMELQKIGWTQICMQYQTNPKSYDDRRTFIHCLAEDLHNRNLMSWQGLYTWLIGFDQPNLTLSYVVPLTSMEYRAIQYGRNCTQKIDIEM